MTTRWKILLTIVLATAVWYACCGCSQLDMRSRPVSHTPTEGALADAYRIINETGFYGGLPQSKTTIRLADLTNEEEMGHMTQYLNGTFVISIDLKTNPVERAAEFTLGHEMCHQSDRISGINEGEDSHGPAFQACMLHLATRGVFKDLW
jgi:hypothetical protein